MTVWRYRRKGMLTIVNIGDAGISFKQRSRVLINMWLPVNLFSHQLDPGNDWRRLFTFRCPEEARS